MVAQLLWIAAVYASAVILVHVLHIRTRTRRTSEDGSSLHYVLITRNHEAVIEGYVRALSLHGFVTGKRIRVTCMDDRSSDRTLMVVSRLMQGGNAVELGDIGALERCEREAGPCGHKTRREVAEMTAVRRDVSPAGQEVQSPEQGMFLAEREQAQAGRELIIDLRLSEALLPPAFLRALGGRGFGSGRG